LPNVPPVETEDSLPEPRAPFTTGSVLRRLARRLELDETSRIVEFGVVGKSAGVLLARELGCRATVAEASSELLEGVRAEAEAAGVLGQLVLLQVDAGAPSIPAEAFELAITGGRVGALAPLARLLRPALVPSHGRLAAVVAARVGLVPRDLGPWEKALGSSLRTPQAELAELVHSGFEPEWAEALSEAQLVELYGAHPAPADEEAALVQSGPSGVSFVLVAGRRREPNERPPAARDRG
jgi:hypothetical protein